MAQLYAPYVLGSMTFAYLSKVMYDYNTSELVEPMETIIEETETEIVVEPIEETNEELFKCSKCLENKPLFSFSKNQQKKKPLNMWKCKNCTK
tara:strand:- start:669 stop:947 length:279 start_codon:yes stop_codon:yes gene_type:complete